MTFMTSESNNATQFFRHCPSKCANHIHSQWDRPELMNRFCCSPLIDWLERNSVNEPLGSIFHGTCGFIYRLLQLFYSSDHWPTKHDVGMKQRCMSERWMMKYLGNWPAIAIQIVVGWINYRYFTPKRGKSKYQYPHSVGFSFVYFEKSPKIYNVQDKIDEFHVIYTDIE